MLVVIVLAAGSVWLVMGKSLPDLPFLPESNPAVRASTQTAPPPAPTSIRPAATRPAPAPTTPLSTPVTPPLPTAIRPTPTSAVQSPYPGKIVYACQVDQDQAHDQICLFNPVSASMPVERILTRERYAGHKYPSLSPGGNSILYVYTSGRTTQIMEMDLSGNVLRELTQPGDFGTINFPTYSPDGRWIAFNAAVDSGSQHVVYIMPASGSQSPVAVVKMNQSVYFNAWSPDSSQILYQVGRVTDNDETLLYTVRRDGSDPRQIHGVSRVDGRCDWSPDGQKIVVSSGPAGDRDIFSIDLTTGRSEQLTSGGNNRAPVFSPDGRWLLFVSYRDHKSESDWAENGAELYMIPAEGGKAARLTSNRYYDYLPRWGW